MVRAIGSRAGSGTQAGPKSAMTICSVRAHFLAASRSAACGSRPRGPKVPCAWNSVPTARCRRLPSTYHPAASGIPSPARQSEKFGHSRPKEPEMAPRCCVRRRGFTLVEVLVAMAIVSVALLAGLRAAGQGTASVSELRSRLLAGWVAENLLAEQRARGEWL